MAFLYMPILVLIVLSFNQNKSRGAWTGFTFDWYRKLFTNRLILGAFVNTAIVCWSICSAQSSTGYYLLGSFGAKWLGIF